MSCRRQAAQNLVYHRHALGIRGSDARGHNELGCILIRQGKMAEAAAALERAVHLAPDYGDAYRNLGNVRAAEGNVGAARRAYRKALRHLPDDPGARHMLRAMRGEEPEAPPAGHVRTLFDQYAPGFDRHLDKSLDYRVPAMMRDLLEARPEMNSPFANGVDLGCGTGLSGEAFAGKAERLHGIDLSAGMLARAREKGVYHTLAQGDICSVLRSWTGSFDLFLAADVLVYLGDLEEIFRTVGSRALPGAVFLFSTERGRQRDYRLRTSGRYAHRRGYLFNLAATFAFHPLECREAAIRKERGRWLHGDIYLLQRSVRT